MFQQEAKLCQIKLQYEDLTYAESKIRLHQYALINYPRIRGLMAFKWMQIYHCIQINF